MRSLLQDELSVLLARLTRCVPLPDARGTSTRAEAVEFQSVQVTL